MMQDALPITLKINDCSIDFINEQETISAVSKLSFSIAKGETYALVGESGSGKTQLALSILKLTPQNAWIHSHSQILFDSQNTLALSEASLRPIRGKDIGMIFQEPMTSLNPVMMIGQQLMESICCHQSLSQSGARRSALQWLKEVGLPHPRTVFFKYPHELSGGMKQRVMIAMAIANSPKLLIADEPTTALDVTIQSQILTLLQNLQKKYGMSILLITHDLGVVRQIAHRIGVLYQGCLVEESSTESFFEKCMHPYSQQLLHSVPSIERRNFFLLEKTYQNDWVPKENEGCVFLSRCSYARMQCRDQRPEFHQIDPSHVVLCHGFSFLGEHALTQRKKQNNAFDTVCLHVRDLKIYYAHHSGLFRRAKGYNRACDQINMTLYEGETLAVVGESGSGKTTLAKGLVHLIPPTEGEIVWTFQEKIIPKEKLPQWVQFVFQDPFSSLNPKQTILEILMEGLHALYSSEKWSAKRKRILHVLKQVGLNEDQLSRYPHEFSGGQRQRIAIARALVVDPKVFILDEPTSALDVTIQAQILNLLKSLQQERKLSYIFITHNISVVSYFADRIIVMYLGKIVEVGPSEILLKNPRHPYTKMLMESAPCIQETKKIEVHEEPEKSMTETGCVFAKRCPNAKPVCLQETPATQQIGLNHFVACVDVS